MTRKKRTHDHNCEKCMTMNMTYNNRYSFVKEILNLNGNFPDKIKLKIKIKIQR